MVRFSVENMRNHGALRNRGLDVLLFANGSLTQGVMVARLLDSLASPRIICADGGALHARALRLKPHTIIGDLDSLSAEDVAAFKAAGAEIIQFPPEKNETDLELALRHCQRVGATTIRILGALGGRFDQTLANILLLTQASLGDLDIAVVDGDQTIRLLRPGVHRIQGERGDTISLIPLSESGEGLRSRRLKYPLRGESLHRGPARGISNVMLAETSELEFDGGLLLLVHTSGRA